MGAFQTFESWGFQFHFDRNEEGTTGEASNRMQVLAADLQKHSCTRTKLGLFECRLAADREVGGIARVLPPLPLESTHCTV